MEIQEVIYGESDWNLGNYVEIKGKCNSTEATEINKLTRKYGLFPSFLPILGTKSIDFYGNHIYSTIACKGSLKITLNTSNNGLEFIVSMDGRRTNNFFKKFQNEFGKIEQELIQYD